MGAQGHLGHRNDSSHDHEPENTRRRKRAQKYEDSTDDPSAEDRHLSQQYIVNVSRCHTPKHPTDDSNKDDIGDDSPCVLFLYVKVGRITQQVHRHHVCVATNARHKKEDVEDGEKIALSRVLLKFDATD